MTDTPTRKAPKVRRTVARHGKIKAQTRLQAWLSVGFKFVGAAMVAVLAIVGVSAWELTSTLNGRGFQILGSDGKAIEVPTIEDLNGPINMLLVGSDTRKGQGGGFGNFTSELADVIILLHISEDRKNAVALSFPRDLLVPWPACPSTSGGSGYLPQSLGQINATIANGGPGCTLLTVEKLTGVKIPYLAMIDFRGVIEMSNAIGGVKVCLARDIEDTYTHTSLKAGNVTLMGKQALQFLRTRHGVGDGSDLSRISNQQVFLTSLVRKVKSQGVLTNPIYLYSLAKAAARNMTLSSSLSDINVMVGIASALKDIELDKVTFLQVPSRGGLPAPYSGRVMPVYEQANILFDMIAKDQPLILNEANTGSGSVVKPSASPSASSGSGASASPSPSSTSNGTLPDWARGSNAATTTCSN